MNPDKELPKFAVLQLSGCSGCEVSLLNADDWLDKFQLVYMPLVVSTSKMPDDIEVLLVSGGVRNEEDEFNLRKAAARSKKVIAVGTCALSGGVVQLGDRDDVRETFLSQSQRRRLPDLLPKSHPVDDVVKVDLYLPGCPPTPELFMAALRDPQGFNASTIVCQECGRKKLTDMRPNHLTGQRETHVVDDICLVNQGFLCVGTTTRGGCRALCTRPGHPCVGCRGPANPYLAKEIDVALDNLRRTFTRMTDIPADEVETALKSPWLSLFLFQFSDYGGGAQRPYRDKDKVL